MAAGFPGGIAQLGEHLPCKQGVKGSNPFISTVIRKRMTKKEASDDAQVINVYTFTTNKETPDGVQVINLRLMTMFIENYTLKQTSRIQNIQDIRGYSVRRLTE